MTVFGVTVSMTVFWLAVVIVFVIIEGLTMGLTTIWFAGGALIACAAAFFGAGIAVQVVLFLSVSAVLLLSTRKVFVRKLRTGTEKTNLEALIGKEVSVTSTITPDAPGMVRIGGQDWTAVCADSRRTLVDGARVKVIGIEGVKAIVAPQEEQED